MSLPAGQARLRRRPDLVARAVTAVGDREAASNSLASGPSVISDGRGGDGSRIRAIVAATHHYYAHLHSLKGIGSAVLAILLWPLLFLGIDLHIR